MFCRARARFQLVRLAITSINSTSLPAVGRYIFHKIQLKVVTEGLASDEESALSGGTSLKDILSEECWLVLASNSRCWLMMVTVGYQWLPMAGVGCCCLVLADDV